MSVVLDRLPDVRCIVVRGSGGIFSPCSDIEQFLHLDAAEPEAHFPRVFDVLTAPTRVGKPVVTAVQGLALDGAIAEEGAAVAWQEKVAARISAPSLMVVQMGKRAFQQAKDTEFHTTRRFMGQMVALNSPTEDSKRRIGVFLEYAWPEGWAASCSGLLPARVAFFEERGVALAGGR